MSDFHTYLHIIDANKRALYRSTLQAFADSHSKARHSAATPHEPDFIANLAAYGIPRMAADWKRILAPFGVATSVVSVFCHSRPIVHHSLSTTNPEIGDLLIVHVHHPRKGKSKRTALLLQAKMMNDLTVELNTNDHQLLLYQHWPTFQFVRPSIPGVTLDVKPKQAHRGAQYLLVDDDHFMGPYSCVYSISEADDTLIPGQSLSRAIYKVLCFDEGKEFLGRKASTRRLDWSRLIWMLMEQSIGKNFKRKNIGVHSKPRVHGSNLSGMSGLFACLTSNPGTRHHSFLSDVFGAEKWNQIELGEGGNHLFESNEDVGIPTVIIETSYMDSEKIERAGG